MIRNETKDWIRLDNAAMMFPAGSGKKNSRVFRLTCQLYEPVDPEVLQRAVDEAVKHSPGFVCHIRTGVFWHYLEHSREKPLVHNEKFTPCYPIYGGGKKRLLFYVSYYRDRVYIEMHHTLADGTGGMQFFSSIISHYLRALHPEELRDLPEPDYGAPPSMLQEDAFGKHYNRSSRMVRIRIPRAAQLSGKHTVDMSYRILEGAVPATDVVALAHRHGATVAVLLCALYMRAIAATLPDLDRELPVVVNIPVNLRSFFGSSTLKNFFATTTISYNFSERSGEIDDLVASIAEQLKRSTTKEALSARIDSMVTMQRNPLMRIAPIFLKDAAIRISKSINEKGESAVLSNVGRVKLPEELTPYIKLFSGTMSTSNMHLIVFTYGAVMTLTFSSSFEENQVALHFFRALAAEGINVELTTNYNQ